MKMPACFYLCRMLKYIILVFLIYFLYRFVFHFLIPVGRATRDIRKKMSEFQNRMQEQQGFKTEPQPKKENKNKTTGEYIDFEELR